MGRLGATDALIGGIGLACEIGATSRFIPTEDDTLTEPRVLASNGRVLDVRLEARRPVAAAGRQRLPPAGGTAAVLSFNGSVPGPTPTCRPATGSA